MNTKEIILAIIIVIMVVIGLFVVGNFLWNKPPKPVEQSFIINQQTSTPATLIRGPELQGPVVEPDGKK